MSQLCEVMILRTQFDARYPGLHHIWTLEKIITREICRHDPCNWDRGIELTYLTTATSRSGQALSTTEFLGYIERTLEIWVDDCDTEDPMEPALREAFDLKDIG